MQQFNASPKTVQEMFSTHTEYIIPEYQRKYSWEEENCSELWEDLTDFHEKSDTEKEYFLGNIVLCGSKESQNKKEVIDGQQRLTTIALLMAALYHASQTNQQKGHFDLENCIYTHDSVTGKLESLRIKSNVIDAESGNLAKAIKEAECDGGIYQANYGLFKKRIDEKLSCMSRDEDKMSWLNDFISCLLRKVIFLSIEAADFDDALKIFETLNARGLDLTNSDIIKSILYKNGKGKDQAWLDDWNNLKNHDVLLLNCMKMKTAESGTSTKEKATIRKYFMSGEGKAMLEDPEAFVSHLERIQSCLNFNPEKDLPDGSDCLKLLEILKRVRGDAWTHSNVLYLYKHVNDDGIVDCDLAEYKKVLKQIVRYVFWCKSNGKQLGKVFNGLNQSLAEDPANWISSDKVSVEKIDIKQLLENNQNYLAMVCFAHAYSAKDQPFIEEPVEIEHVYPKTKQGRHSYCACSAENLNHLGNLLVLESSINRRVKNKKFDEKKDSYKNSGFNRAREFHKITSWSDESIEARGKRIVSEIIEWLKL